MSAPASPPIDVAIVGGSFAGLSAGLPVARARRSVVVFDSGLTRNRFAAASHGFLGQDGRAPDAIRLDGRAQFLAYPTARLVEDEVVAIDGERDRFRLMTRGGAEVLARRVVLAFGMRDALPDIPGLAECWGRSAMQCPYCHGYEAADLPTGLLVTGASPLHHARLLGDWTGDLVVFANGQALAPDDRAAIDALGLRVHDAPVVRIEATEGHIQAVHLASGARIPREALYLATRAAPATDLADRLGCRMSEGPHGPYVAVDMMQQTSVPRVFAAGDLTRPFYNAPAAAADGARAGSAAHQSLHFAMAPIVAAA